jgi:hypothetical protein
MARTSQGDGAKRQILISLIGSEEEDEQDEGDTGWYFQLFSYPLACETPALK